MTYKGKSTDITDSTATGRSIIRAVDGSAARTIINAASGIVPTGVKTSGYTAVAGDLVICDATTNAFAVTLPAAPSAGTRIAVSKIDTTTNAITIAAAGTDVFNRAGGAGALSLALQWQSTTLQYGNGIWHVVSDDLSLGKLDSRYLSASASIPQSSVTNLTTNLAAKEDTANKGVANGYASLDTGGKVPIGQLPSSLMEYQGVWNASTNTPTLTDGTGSTGDVYRVSVSGSQNLGSGSISFNVGDYVILNSSLVWEKSDTTDAVASVSGYTGNITQDQITGLSSTGVVTRTGTNTLSTVTAPAGALVGTTETQTLTNKTVVHGFATTAVAGLSYILNSTSAQIQQYTGTGADSFVRLPNNVNAGHFYWIVNRSSALVYLNNFDGTGYIDTVQAGCTAFVYAVTNNPSLASGWFCQYAGTSIPARGDKFTFSGGKLALTVAGSGTGLITFPATTDTGVTLAAAQALTNKTIDGSLNTLSNVPQSAVTNLTTSLSGKEPTITAGTTGQYYRGDKTFQTLDKTAVGLSNVDNTSDASKPVSTATQTALDLKENTSNKGIANGYASLDSGGKVPVTQLPSSIMEYQGVWNASTNTPTLANGTGSTGDVYRVSVAGTSLGFTFGVGDYVIFNGNTWEKSDTTDAVASVAGRTGDIALTSSDVGLGNVDNTSNATERAATATLTNKSIALGSNTVSGTLSQFNAAVTDADLARTDAAQTFTGVQTMTSPALTTPVITGEITGTYSFGGTPTFPTLNQNTTGTAGNVTGTVAVANGGTGLTTLAANNVLLGNGTSTVQGVAPGTSGNVLTSDGTTWTSAAATGGGGSGAGAGAVDGGTAASAGPLTLDGGTAASTGSGALTQVQFRRGTAESWTSSNPVLASGETGFESNTGKFKIGDGSTAWTTLGYAGGDSARIARSISTLTAPTTLGAAAGTDYVALCSSANSGDSSYLSNVALLHGNGANNSTTITDSALGVNWTVGGTAKISTTQSKFGGSSMAFDGSAGCVINAPVGASWTFGTADFTVEGWVYVTAAATNSNGIFQQGTSAFASSTTNSLGFGTVTSGSKWQIYAKNTNTSSTASWSTATWYHFALVRSGTTTTLYIDGTSVITVTADSTNYTGTHFGLGSLFGTAVGAVHNGYIDEFRVTKGVARYTANFTAPTAAFSDSTFGTPTLPTAVGNNNQYTIKNTTPGTITPATTSSQTIDGTTPAAIAANGTIRLVSDGSNWRTV
jgi:hypothetical protein